MELIYLIYIVCVISDIELYVSDPISVTFDTYGDYLCCFDVENNVECYI